MWINREKYETLVNNYNKAVEGFRAKDKTIEGFKDELTPLKGSISKKEADAQKELSETNDDIREFIEAASNLYPAIFSEPVPLTLDSWRYYYNGAGSIFSRLRMTNLTEKFKQGIKDRDDKARITKFMEEILPKVLVPKNKMKITRTRGRKNLIEKVEITHSGNDKS